MPSLKNVLSEIQDQNVKNFIEFIDTHPLAKQKLALAGFEWAITPLVPAVIRDSESVLETNSSPTEEDTLEITEAVALESIAAPSTERAIVFDESDDSDIGFVPAQYHNKKTTTTGFGFWTGGSSSANLRYQIQGIGGEAEKPYVGYSRGYGGSGVSGGYTGWDDEFDYYHGGRHDLDNRASLSRSSAANPGGLGYARTSNSVVPSASNSGENFDRALTGYGDPVSRGDWATVKNKSANRFSEAVEEYNGEPVKIVAYGIGGKNAFLTVERLDGSLSYGRYHDVGFVKEFTKVSPESVEAIKKSIQSEPGDELETRLNAMRQTQLENPDLLSDSDTHPRD